MSRFLPGVVLTGALLALLPVAGPAQAAGEEVKCSRDKVQLDPTLSANLTSLGIPQTWDLPANGEGVTVAVVDSGVEVGNQHLGPETVLPGTSFVGGDPRGWGDVTGHGTALSGIIGARLVDGSGLLGVAYGAKILPVRVNLNDPPQEGEAALPFIPTAGRIAQGIRWAADNGAAVINVSMSAGAADEGLPELRAAVAHAHRRDVVVVASAGNNADQAPSRTEVRYPAVLPHVIGVAALNSSGVVDAATLHGPQNDVAAPGASVLLSFFVNGDCVSNGARPYSSWAAGYVSGVAAQLRQRFPEESADEIEYRILASADRARLASRDDVTGWGRLSAYDALTMTIDPERPGPPVPGEAGAPQQDAEATAIPALAARSDPWAGPRRRVVWWGLAGLGLAALASVLRPLVRRRLRGGPGTQEV